jgi:peptidoglycan/xylan/chitin deacetylase (PgdA/CDA1 family)
MTGPMARAAARARGWARARVQGRAFILGYHRVAQCDWDPAGLAIRSDRFEQQLRRVMRFGTVVPLSRVTAYLDGEPLPPRAIALTFDDGYRDHLTTLLPVLERYGLPATVFITTGSPGGFFWWDELAALLNPAHRLPRRLAVDFSEGPDAWLPEDGLQVGDAGSAADRHRLYHEMADRLAALAPEARRHALARLRSWAGTRAEPPEGARSLTHQEIMELARSPLIEIAAHTVTHPRLADLPVAAARAEVEESLATLSRLTGAPVTGFSYPQGSTSSAVRATVAAAGATHACASHAGLVGRRSDRLLLPRFWPGDFGSGRLARWIHARWLGL